MGSHRIVVDRPGLDSRVKTYLTVDQFNGGGSVANASQNTNHLCSYP
jgi:hypothetical protein